jgi:peptide-methionine (S)-S-oxide reductase
MLRELGALALLPFLAAGLARAQEERTAHILPAPALQIAAPAHAGLQTAVFSGGCFWGVQGVFSHVSGVVRAVTGYTGGRATTAHYDMVSTGLTGHAEAVEVTYDPKRVTYDQLLKILFSVALDPTERNRQGPDEGSRYRSVLWTSDLATAREAQAYIRQLDRDHAFPAPIATTVQPLQEFWPAERHHQDFMALHPTSPYIQAWDVSKVDALRMLYPQLFSPVAVCSL